MVEIYHSHIFIRNEDDVIRLIDNDYIRDKTRSAIFRSFYILIGGCEIVSTQIVNRLRFYFSRSRIRVPGPGEI